MKINNCESKKFNVTKWIFFFTNTSITYTFKKQEFGIVSIRFYFHKIMFDFLQIF